MRKLTKTAAVVASMAVMAMGATVMASAAQEGWVQTGSNWYYYINGNAIENQWMQAGDKWYFLGEDGKMVKNAFIQDGEELDVDDKTDLDATEDDAIYYVGSDGAMITGWRQIDLKTTGGSTTPKNSNEWYYFGGSGEMFGERWVQAGDKWYYLGEDGAMVKNDYAEDGDEYYLNKNGEWVTGWYKVTSDDLEVLDVEEDEWVYFDDDGKIAENGWMKINNSWYYFGAVSQSATGITNYAKPSVASSQMASETFIGVGSDNFYLKSSGAMETGWFSVKVDNEKNQYYANSSGVIQKNKVQTVSSKNYYLDEAGINRSDDYDYAYSIKEPKDDRSGYTTKYYPIDGVTTLADAKAALDSNAELNGKSVTIYKLKSSSSYSYTPQTPSAN